MYYLEVAAEKCLIVLHLDLKKLVGLLLVLCDEQEGEKLAAVSQHQHQVRNQDMNREYAVKYL